MKRIFSILFALVLAVSLMLVPAASVGASPGPGIVGLWHLDEGSGATTVSDSSGNGNTGTIYRATPGVPGKFGNALSFDGMDDYVRVPGSDSLEAITSAITVEAWLKFDDVRDAFYVRTPFDKDPKAWGLDRWSGRLRFYIYDGGTPTICELSWSPTTDGWYHIAGTYDGTVLKLYVNGALLKSFDYSGAIDSTDMGVVIGARHSEGGWGFHRGIIDEVRIWNHALTAGEIAYNYDLGDVPIDIKPGSLPNSVNLKDQGLLPVAILGSASFDVSNVNPEKIQLGDVSLATRGSAKAPKLAYSYEDVNGDGHLDLIAFFSVPQLVSTGVLDATTTALALMAELYDGRAMTGTDSVNIVPQ